MTKSVVTRLLNELQDVTFTFRNSQNTYLKHLKSREARSNVFFETQDFTTIDLNDDTTDNEKRNAVDSFDNFLTPKVTSVNGFLQDTDEQIDQY